MKSQPLVSVICLCYNHQRFIEDSILSVLNQTYPNIEIIVVDDFSSDGSKEVIQRLGDKHSEVQILLLDHNHGNTAAFNKGFEASSGKFIIDLATDDILCPERVAEGLKTFEQSSSKVGVNFTNAEIIDERSKLLEHFYAVDANGLALDKPPQGDLYLELIRRFFICPPTMMYKRSVLEELNGYDEELHYEDFDFWIRSSRLFDYCFTDQVLVKRRKLKDSHSSQQFKINSSHMQSTYRVCEKIKSLNKTDAENKALKNRIYYEMKQCIKLLNPRLFIKYYHLLRSI